MTGVPPVVTPNRSIYCIYDRVAQTWIGQLLVDRHPAPVCRLFSQLLGDKSTALNQHPADYDLVFVGYIDDDGNLSFGERQVVMTGSSWLLMQAPVLSND